MPETPGSGKGARPGGFLGSLKEALAAASREDTIVPAPVSVPPPTPQPRAPAAPSASSAEPPQAPAEQAAPVRAASSEAGAALSAAEAARQARGVTSLKLADKHTEFDGTNTTRMVRMPKMSDTPAAPLSVDDEPARTQLVRGRQPMKRGQFVTDPVVGWLVIVGGPGLGSYRPVFEGNNTIGRSASNRIALDFGDEAISADEQAYLRYDSNDRSFLLVPNMSKTNIVSLNTTRPTSAVEIKAMDVITMGRTQLVFMPFCGPEFDWSEISETKD